MSEQTILLTSIAMYAAIWHRGRQNLGMARFYQRGIGGPASPAHNRLFQGAVYLPMVAALLAYTHLAPREYEGEPYLALNLGTEVTSLVAIVAAGWVIAYFVWTVWRDRADRLLMAPHNSGIRVHPGECWVVLAHVVALGSSYALGAANASFLLVLAVHHEVQYLYFTYAMARRSEGFQSAKSVSNDTALTSAMADASFKLEPEFRREVRHAASFLRWPVIAFVAAVGGGWLELAWLAPFGVGGLFCHYWLDGRIWTRKSLNA